MMTIPEMFWQFMQEREQIRHRRRLGFLPPFTEDERLRRYFFPNVRRMDDPRTQWLHWVLLAEIDDPEKLCMAVVLFRLFGSIETARQLRPMLCGPGYSEHHMLSLLMPILKPFKGRLMQRVERAADLGAVVESCNDIVRRGGLWPVLRGATMQEVTETISSIRKIGPELAYEIACDLRHTPVLEGAPDVQKWALPGRSATEVAGLFLGREMRSRREADRSDTVALMRSLLRDAPDDWEMSEIQRGLTMFHFWVRDEPPKRRFKCK